MLIIAVMHVLPAASQTVLKMGASGGPAGNGPATTAQAVTLYESGTTAYTPAITVTYSLTNQQFGAGTLEGLSANSAMNFGGTLNASANNAIGAQAYYGLMNAISSPLNNMFSGCNSCGAAGIDVTTDRAISFFNCTEGFINASTGANTQALNARVYVGDITLTFNRPVSNPVLQFVGMGGTTSITRSGKIYDMGFATEFDLVGSNVTLSKLAGNTYLNVTAAQITNTATWYGSSSQGSASNGITRYAASGSIVLQGTNITSVTFKAYVHGDGGRVSNGATVVTADAGFNPLWAFGATNAFGAAGNVSGDLMLFGVSVQKPVTVSGNVFKDPNGGNVNNSTGTTNVVPAGMYANLVDANGKVVASVTFNTDGTYSFPATFEGNYTVNISTTSGTQGAAAPAASLPSGWLATGEYNGTPNSGNDGTVNGTSASFAVSSSDVININFGIEQPPVSPNQSYTVAQPASNASLSLNGTGLITSPGALSGTDAEDGTLGTGKTFSITVGAGMNGNKLYYNGIEITGTVSIPNYDPSLLTVKYSGAGSTGLSFTYKSYDAAGVPSAAATYSINWLLALPVRVFETSVTLNGSTASISWKTENEVNTSYFIVERSTSNTSFTAVANQAAAGSSIAAKYYSIQDDIAGINAPVVYYRVKLVDRDGKITSSNTVAIRMAGIDAVKLFPNPFVETVNVSFYSNVNTTAVLRITDMNGKTIARVSSKVVKGNNQVNINNLKNIPAGMYTLELTNEERTISFVQKIIK